MAILKCSHLGNPVLRRVTAKVDPAELATPAMQRLIDDMFETMREYDGVGLAAPQVHVSKQLAVIDGELLDDDPKVPAAAKKLFVVVNPVVRPKGDKKFTHWEGCLSVPGFRGRVPRFRDVELEALDRDGKPYRMTASGYFAAVVQHENDHLGGKVYLDRMPDLTMLAYLKEWRHHWEGDDESLDEPVV